MVALDDACFIAQQTQATCPPPNTLLTGYLSLYLHSQTSDWTLNRSLNAARTLSTHITVLRCSNRHGAFANVPTTLRIIMYARR